MPSRNFGRDLALVHGLVGEHGLTDDVADGKDMRHIGSHLLVDRDEAARIDRHTGLVGVDAVAIRSSADGHQHAIKTGGSRRARALEIHRQFIGSGLDLDHPRAGHDAGQARLQALL